MKMINKIREEAIIRTVKIGDKDKEYYEKIIDKTVIKAVLQANYNMSYKIGLEDDE